MLHTPKFASRISIVISTFILCIKFSAYLVTGSQAIFSDALESIVNVVAAIVAYFLISLSAQPADSNHPYGHGKGEFFSASFEGGLITFAAIAIIVRAAYSLVIQHSLSELNFGLGLVICATLVNLLLGIYMLYAARLNNSSALAASGHHILSDVWTTAASLVSLFLVKFTGIIQFDPLAALLMGLFLGWTGFKIIRKSLGALLDEEDADLLTELSRAFNAVHVPGIIKIHHTRVMRAGNYHYIDAHVVVPEFWNILQAHDEVNIFERKLMKEHTSNGEIHFHIDPCRKQHCQNCDLAACSIRNEQFVELRRYSASNITARKAS